MPALADQDDYELLIGPVDPADEPRLDFMLEVASSTVTTVAPGLYPYYVWPLDDQGIPADPGPVPDPAVYVTCQVASHYLADPGGGGGRVMMERVGLVQTHYDTTAWDPSTGTLPPGWQLMLKQWLPSSLASVPLVVPHPAEAALYRWWAWDQEAVP
jgi:hypothetical protein